MSVQHAIRTGAVCCFLFLTLIAQSIPARAYEEDTHFMVTYVLLRAAGFTDSEALTVARYDQGMDDSPGTVAAGGIGGIIPNVAEESLWHSIPTDGKAQSVIGRRAEMWKQTLSIKDPTTQLKMLGVFYHYQQDFWAHRYHQNSDPANFDPYSTPFGHAKHGHQPDRPPFDPVCALRSLEDGLTYARSFLLQCLRRNPNSLFNGYTAAKGAVDTNWPDKRKGKHFNQIVLDKSTPARSFMTGLIHAQIDAYTSSFSANPRFPARYTADQVKYDKLRINLQRVCDDHGLNITIPASREKVSNLTTPMIQAWIPKPSYIPSPSQPYTPPPPKPTKPYTPPPPKPPKSYIPPRK